MNKKEIKKIASEVVAIIQSSKATFFGNENDKDASPTTDEWLAELKAEITTNVEMFFYKLLEK